MTYTWSMHFKMEHVGYALNILLYDLYVYVIHVYTRIYKISNYMDMRGEYFHQFLHKIARSSSTHQARGESCEWLCFLPHSKNERMSTLKEGGTKTQKENMVFQLPTTIFQGKRLVSFSGEYNKSL